MKRANIGESTITRNMGKSSFFSLTTTLGGKDCYFPFGDEVQKGTVVSGEARKVAEHGFKSPDLHPCSQPANAAELNAERKIL